MPETQKTQTTLELPEADEILLNRIEQVMSAVRLLHPLLDLLAEAKTEEYAGASEDLTEVLKSLYTTTINTAAKVEEIDTRIQQLSREIAAIREALQIPIN